MALVNVAYDTLKAVIVRGVGAMVNAHKTSHQDSGTDEVNVTGLSGLLADSQTPLQHASSHQDGGSDMIQSLKANPIVLDNVSGEVSISYDSDTSSLIISTAGQNFRIHSGYTAFDGPFIIKDLLDNQTTRFDASGAIGFNGVNPVAQSSPITNVSGGAVIDAEARTALNALLAYVRLRGDIAT